LFLMQSTVKPQEFSHGSLTKEDLSRELDAADQNLSSDDTFKCGTGGVTHTGRSKLG